MIHNQVIPKVHPHGVSSCALHQYDCAKLKVSHHKWHFNKLETAHAINHMKDATNIALHIQKVSRHID